MAEKAQTFENHARMVPGYHYVGTLLLFAALVLALIRVVQEPSIDTVIPVLLALGLGVVGWYTRAFPLRAQDRVIRLEERLRMERLLADDLKSRAHEFTTEQLIALRFCSDAELPDLAQRVLEDGLEDRDEIKSRIREWRADYERV